MDRLIMVYNADGGLVNGAIDLMHKMFSPATYACRLCEVTYGPFGMKRDWRATIDALPMPVTFLHRDEWMAAYPDNPTALPAIQVEQGGKLSPLVSAEDFDGVRSLEGLKALLAERLSAAAPSPAPRAQALAAP